MIKPYYKKPKKDYTDNLALACVHALSGKPIYYQTRSGCLLCKKCFTHYNNYGVDKDGHWKIPLNEDISNLKTICKLCANRIIKNQSK
jgi:hypothetical protein